MSFIPIDQSGKQAYPYDTRPLKIKVYMWLWENIGIPLLGKTVKGKIIQLEHIKGEKMKFINCTFKRCKFDGLKLVFILRSTVEHDTLRPEFHNMSMCAVRHCVLKKVEPIIQEEN